MGVPDGSVEVKTRYMMENAGQIDCLVLRGCYATNLIPAYVYKQLNPKGRMYVGLDANSSWMDSIIWTNSDFMQFMNNCEVISTSCTAMQKYLSEKWPWNIECIPNGYYDFGRNHIPPVLDEKENVILTVGKLGTA